MSSGDSVGKISLDLEVKSDLSNQMNQMATAIGKKLEQSLGGGISSVLNMLNKSIESSMKSINATIKAALDEMKTNAQATINSIMSLTKNIKVPKQHLPVSSISPVTNAINNATSVRGPPTVSRIASRTAPSIDTEAIKSKIQNLSNTLDNVNARIEQQKDKLMQLKEAYATTFSVNRKNTLNEQILKTEASINRLIGQSDRLGFQLNGLDTKLANAGNSTSGASNKMNSASNSINKYSNNTKKATKNTSLLGSIMKRAGDSSNTLSKKISSASNSIMGNLKKIYKYAMAFMGFRVGIRAIRAIGKYLRETFKTNEQFSASLAQVKTNLMIAFTPILNNAMPILNQFMVWLSKATQYIASFTSAIFGTTYNASKASTQQLINAKKAMGLYGDTTKKTKNILMGFDEINKITKDDDTSSDETPVLVNPSLDVGTIDAQMKALVDKIKGILDKVFEPMKSAWNSEGQNTINAVKYALNSIKTLLGDIGRSFAEVWDNGTGEKTCTLILKILQTIFNIIGDIATSFDKAWTSGNTGTAIIQGLFDILNNVLKCILNIGENFRNAWNDNGAGDALLGSVLGLLKDIVQTLADVTSGMSDSFGKATESLFPTMINFVTSVAGSLDNITQGFKVIWDNGGKVLFDGIVQLIVQIAELIINLSSSVFSDFSVVFKDVLAPAIGIVFDVVGTLLGKLAEFIEWINNNKSIIDGLTTAVEALVGAWEITKLLAFIQVSGGVIGAIKAITTSLWACTGAKVADKLESIALTAMYAKDFIVSIASGTAKLVEQATQWAINTGLKYADIVATGAMTVATTAWSVICGIAAIATTALGAAFAFLTSPIGLIILAIAAVIAIVVLLIKHWDTVKEVASECWEEIKEVWNSVASWFKTNVIDPLCNFFKNLWYSICNIFGSIKEWFSAKFTEAWNAIKNVFSGVGSFFSNIWNTIKSVFTSIGGAIGNAIGGAFKKVVNSIIGFAENTINGFIKAINGAIGLINKIPGVNISKLNLLQIPKLAQGGIIDQPTLSMVGEAGKEAVVPLENNTGGLDLIASKIAEKLRSVGNNHGSNNNDRPLQIQLILADGTSLGHATISSVNEIARMNGTSSLLT